MSLCGRTNRMARPRCTQPPGTAPLRSSRCFWTPKQPLPRSGRRCDAHALCLANPRCHRGCSPHGQGDQLRPPRPPRGCVDAATHSVACGGRVRRRLLRPRAHQRRRGRQCGGQGACASQNLLRSPSGTRWAGWWRQTLVTVDLYTSAALVVGLQNSRSLDSHVLRAAR